MVTSSSTGRQPGFRTATRILVAEDESGIAMALQDDFRSEGYEVEVVRDGETAIRRASEQSFDVIVLDVTLPRKDGLDVCRDLRRAGVHTPILLLAAQTGEAERVLALELGADDYVTKPYRPRELRARVKALLRRAAGELPKIYRFGDVEVNLTRCELRRRGQLVELTPLELKLLAAFIHHRGCVLNRQQLLDEIWNRRTSVNDRIVDNQIMNLRRKIEPVPSHPRYLITVRRIGYRFDG